MNVSFAERPRGLWVVQCTSTAPVCCVVLVSSSLSVLLSTSLVSASPINFAKDSSIYIQSENIDTWPSSRPTITLQAAIRVFRCDEVGFRYNARYLYQLTAQRPVGSHFLLTLDLSGSALILRTGIEMFTKVSTPWKKLVFSN